MFSQLHFPRVLYILQGLYLYFCVILPVVLTITFLLSAFQCCSVPSQQDVPKTPAVTPNQNYHPKDSKMTYVKSLILKILQPSGKQIGAHSKYNTRHIVQKNTKYNQSTMGVMSGLNQLCLSSLKKVKCLLDLKECQDLKSREKQRIIFQCREIVSPNTVTEKGNFIEDHLF